MVGPLVELPLPEAFLHWATQPAWIPHVCLFCHNVWHPLIPLLPQTSSKGVNLKIGYGNLRNVPWDVRVTLRTTRSVKWLAMGWTIGVLWFDSRRDMGNFLFTTAFRTALGPSPMQWVPGALSLGVKWPGCKADYSPPPGVEVKECVELYFHSPIRLHGVVLS
jgi:hypothetical protein